MGRVHPTKGVTADETAKCIFQHLGRFEAPERILTDRGTAFYNELVSELVHMCRAEHELTIAYSKEGNAIVERANQEVIRHLRALLFDKRVYNKWSFEELPVVQRIMNTVEKTATGVTPAELILKNSLRLTKSIFTETSTMDKSRLECMRFGRFTVDSTEARTRAPSLRRSNLRRPLRGPQEHLRSISSTVDNIIIYEM